MRPRPVLRQRRARVHSLTGLGELCFRDGNSVVLIAEIEVQVQVAGIGRRVQQLRLSAWNILALLFVRITIVNQPPFKPLQVSIRLILLRILNLLC